MAQHSSVNSLQLVLSPSLQTKDFGEDFLHLCAVCIVLAVKLARASIVPMTLAERYSPLT